MLRLQTYKTDDVTAREKIAYWNDALCKSFTGKFVETSEAANFSGKYDVMNVGKHNIANVVQNESNVVHAWSHARSDDPAVTLHLQVFGESVSVQNDLAARLQPGEFTFCTSERPYEVIIEKEMGLFVHKIPTEKFRAICDDPLELSCLKFSGTSGPGKIFVAFMQNYWRELTLGMPETQAEEMTNIAIGMLGSVIKAETRTVSEPPQFNGKLDLIRQYIERNIESRDLSPTHIAAAFNMSTRNLHKLFSESNFTVGNYIRYRRLEYARHLLSQPQYQKLSITEIAIMSGFASPAQFSTAFRNDFGVTPSQYRPSD